MLGNLSAVDADGGEGKSKHHSMLLYFFYFDENVMFSLTSQTNPKCRLS